MNFKNSDCRCKNVNKSFNDFNFFEDDTVTCSQKMDVPVPDCLQEPQVCIFIKESMNALALLIQYGRYESHYENKYFKHALGIQSDESQN